MSVTDDYLANNARYAQTFSGPLPMPPASNVAVVACMDARLNVYAILGLNEGEAHVIRNAGGVITDDADPLAGHQPAPARHPRDHPHPPHRLRHAHLHRRRPSSAPSRTRPASSPAGRAEAFPDLDEDVRQSIARIKASPFIPHKDAIRGFVFDVATGKLDEVS